MIFLQNGVGFFLSPGLDVKDLAVDRPIRAPNPQSPRAHEPTSPRTTHARVFLLVGDVPAGLCVPHHRVLGLLHRILRGGAPRVEGLRNEGWPVTDGSWPLAGEVPKGCPEAKKKDWGA